jgi:hypothetical protein
MSIIAFNVPSLRLRIQSFFQVLCKVWRTYISCVSQLWQVLANEHSEVIALRTVFLSHSQWFIKSNRMLLVTYTCLVDVIARVAKYLCFWLQQCSNIKQVVSNIYTRWLTGGAVLKPSQLYLGTTAGVKKDFGSYRNAFLMSTFVFAMFILLQTP